MKHLHPISIFYSAALCVVLMLLTGGAVAATLTPSEQLGKSIFFDDALSINGNQSCAGCHGPGAGWTGPDSDINAFGAVYEGSIPGRFGNRKPPSSAYATLSPILHYVDNEGEALFIGGNFWDGRATGEKLGNPAADQAQGPFLNPMEQALPDSACVVYRVCNAADYPVTFEQVWGPAACDIAWPADVDTACALEGMTVGLSADDRARVDASYDSVALSIAAFEASRESNAFTAKYDYVVGGKAKLSQQERRGFALFHGRGKCFRCHSVTGKKPLFTDFTFDNLGLPRNPDNPWYNSTANSDGSDWVDAGLGGFLAGREDYASFAEENRGKHKVPTLRNVAKAPADGFVKAFGHNGYFKSLKGIIHFYNTRDVKPRCADRFTTEAVALQLGCWPEPEVVENVNRDELGDLGLSSDDEDALVEFLKTLSDGYQP